MTDPGGRQRRKTLALAAAPAIAACLIDSPVAAQEMPSAAPDPFAGLLPADIGFIDLDTAAGVPHRRRQGLSGAVEAAARLDSDLDPWQRSTGGDAATDLRPTIGWRREDRTLELNATAQGHARFQLAHPEENILAGEASLRGRWQPERDLAVGFAASIAHRQEERDAAFTARFTRRPVVYDTLEASAGATYASGPLVLAPYVAADRTTFQEAESASAPSATLDQSRRDMWRLNPGIVAGLRVSPTAIAFAGLAHDRRRYDDDAARNSHGYSVYAGVALAPTPLLHLTARLGYQRQSYRAPYGNPAGVEARVSASYVPDPLTRVTVSYQRDISESGALGLGGAVRQRLRLTFDRTLTRRLGVAAGTGFERMAVAGSGQRATRVGGEAELRFRATPRYELFAAVQTSSGRDRLGDGGERRFTRVAAQAGIRITFS